MDKEWTKLPRFSRDYIDGVESFLDFAYNKGRPQGEEILCPCAKCGNCCWEKRNVVYNHLIATGFAEGYNVWEKMKNEVSFKKKLNTQEKSGKGAFNIEGQVKSSAELLRLFKIKCEKVEANIEGTKASREEGPNNKQFKPLTVATVPTKTKEFEQRKAKELEKFQLHATQNKGAGKIPTTNSQGQKKMPIQAGNSNLQLHPTQSKGVGQIPPTNSQDQKKIPIQTGNSNVQLHPTQSKGAGQIPPTNSQGQKKMPVQAGNSNVQLHPTQSKGAGKIQHTNSQGQKKMPAQAANISSKGSQIQDSKKQPM
ncbi:Transposase-associated domain [Sesbania bispinosa]|nr:Transposase-associated domain [Sesbania bispinosa]